ncbi:hypothetical protein [Mucilaginibacter corticis]|nr:hypothetical protein [Mucilaginibacter corticis]
MITEFHIDAKLDWCMTPIHMKPITYDQWDLPTCSQFELNF